MSSIPSESRAIVGEDDFDPGIAFLNQVALALARSVNEFSNQSCHFSWKLECFACGSRQIGPSGTPRY
jgi:hypothetical protein